AYVYFEDERAVPLMSCSASYDLGWPGLIQNLLPRLGDFGLQSHFDLALTILQMPERAQVNIKRRFSVCGRSLCYPQICDQRFLVGNYTSRFNDTLSGRHQGSVLSRHDAVRMAACGFAALGLRRFMCKV